MSVPNRRGPVAIVLAALLTVLAALGFATAAAAPLAAPYTDAASVAVSNSNPCRHTPVTFTGVGYVPGSTEVLSIGGTGIGRAVAGADGTFTVTITLPQVFVGTRTVTVVGPSGGRLATTQIVIENCGNGGTDPGGAGVGDDGGNTGQGAAGTGGLSTTGVAIFGMLGLALLMVAGGTGLTIGARRRRTAALAA